MQGRKDILSHSIHLQLTLFTAIMRELFSMFTFTFTLAHGDEQRFLHSGVNSAANQFAVVVEKVSNKKYD